MTGADLGKRKTGYIKAIATQEVQGGADWSSQLVYDGTQVKERANVDSACLVAETFNSEQA